MIGLFDFAAPNDEKIMVFFYFFFFFSSLFLSLEIISICFLIIEHQQPECILLNSLPVFVCIFPLEI